MKRFDARTIRHQLHRLFVTTMLALAALSLLGKVAHAQSDTLCGEPEAQAELLLDAYVANLGDFFPLDGEVCEKLVRTATAACHKTVSDAAACVVRIAGSMVKSAKPACKEAAVPSACTADAEGFLAEIRDRVESDAALGHYRCDQDFDPQLFGICVGDPI
jgi:hypothetical protein